PTGPTGPGCCPCNNLLHDPGFDGTTGAFATGWNPTGGATLNDQQQNTHSGILLSGPASPTGATGATRILALELPPTPENAVVFTSVSQTVDIDPGCCYTLSFAADVRDGAIPVASVSFPELPLPTGTPCPPSPADIVSNNFPHIVLQGHTGQSSFLPYTLVVSVPAEATGAVLLSKTF
ncbi:hypothetical protein, partial [Bacillus pseudomycoides]|uniref:hypothetical protein n=1 Tax=Bacillus pseudomycoides TaxID=64104 RepID=UPI002852A21A